MMAYWPWWAGALALGSITVLYHLVIGSRFGVSSAWERVVHWSVEREAERIDHEATDDMAAFQAALASATAAEFGAGLPGDEPASAVAVAAPPAGEPGAASGPQPARRLPMTASLLLLVSILVGAFVTSLVNGRFELRGDMGQAFSDIVVDGPLMWPTLFVGGVLVGIGTRMAGGCSSGHGMSGCSRLQPVSVLATAVFFGTAVAVSSLLYWVI